MDIKKEIQEIIEKIQKDKNFAANFKKDPVKAVEKLLDVNLPDDQMDDIIKAVKAKIDLDKIGDMLDADGDGKLEISDVAGALGKLGGMFGKK